MATYKLVYFNVRGSAEILRFIFAQAGVTYEDKRVQGEEWQKLKPTTPTGQLPLLEVEGKTLTGSRPIARFLAGRFGLAGSNDLENAQLGGMVDYMFDFIVKLYPWFGEKDEEKKAALLAEIIKEQVPKYWGVLNKWIEDNKSDAGWIFGNKPTYVDLFLYCSVEFMVKMDPDLLTKFPAVAKNKAAVEALPNIAKWIKERPQTDN